jgi:site-specific DNA recombinase
MSKTAPPPLSTPTRAAALLRVSTARQAAKHRTDEETLPVQREAVRRFAAAHGWALVREFAEEGVSAWKNRSEDRPVLQELLETGQRHEFDVLIVFKADRLSRQSLEYPMVLHTLRRFGIATWTVVDDGSGRELTVDTPIERLMRFIEGFQAESESANTSVRVLATMKRMAEQGRWTGGPAPYGFRAASLRGGDALPLVIDEHEAAVVARCWPAPWWPGARCGAATIAIGSPGKCASAP